MCLFIHQWEGQFSRKLSKHRAYDEPQQEWIEADPVPQRRPHSVMTLEGGTVWEVSRRESSRAGGGTAGAEADAVNEPAGLRKCRTSTWLLDVGGNDIGLESAGPHHLQPAIGTRTPCGRHSWSQTKNEENSRLAKFKDLTMYFVTTGAEFLKTSAFPQ